MPKGLITNLIFLTIVFCNTPVSGQMRQVYVDNIQADNAINKLSFYSPNEGYAAFTYWIGYTIDSGRTFTKKYITNGNVDFSGYSVNLTFGFGIKGIKAFDRNNIIVYGDYGFVPAILHSSDGGNTFKLVYQLQFGFVPSGGITDMVFPQNDNIGYAVDVDQILKTTNKGLTWSVVKTDPNSCFDHLEALDDNTVFAISDYYIDDIISFNNLPVTNNKILTTGNAGNSWQTVSVPTGDIRNAFFLTAGKGWLNIGQDVFYTANAGVNWIQKNNTAVTPFSSGKIKFINDSTGFALSGFNVIKTTDSGRIWEPLPRDNNFSYLGYAHNDLQFLTTKQLWAGGAHGFLEMSTNSGGTPLPRAFFGIDTAGIIMTGTVFLINYSRAGYSYQWLLNNFPLSNQFNTSYTHAANKLKDTITLIVSNGANKDTLTQYEYFYQSGSISSFTPVIGTEGTLVVINGTGFSDITSVSFGGVLSPYFTVVSSTQINAYVGKGATGNVTVSTPGSIVTANGFTYEPPLTSDLPTIISDSILCKAEKIVVTIENTQAHVRYELLDSLRNSYGYVDSHGGPTAFVTSPISVTGNYVIKATSLDVPASLFFSKKIFIKVEHTRSSFSVNRVNAVPGEKLNFSSHSLETESYKWIFNQDANIASSTSANVSNISYASAGQKTLTLISTSSHGCSDTLMTDAIYTYDKPSGDQTCYAQNIDDSDIHYYTEPSSSINKVVVTNDNGFLISGNANKPILKSRHGVSKKLILEHSAYFAKYTSDGTLSWYMSMPAGGSFNATEKDDSGNIYVVGNSSVLNYLKLPSGDSFRISATPADTISYSAKANWFILKLDSAGNYLWHTVIDDPSSQFRGYQDIPGEPMHIKIRGDQIIITGTFYANLSYCKNGVEQTLFSNLPNNFQRSFLENSFVLKIKPDGTLIWDMYFEINSTNQHYFITGIGIDKYDNYYITGLYEEQANIHDVASMNNITFAGITGTFRSYLLKFNSAGQLLWKSNLVGDGVVIRDIATDDNGTSYITGSHIAYQSQMKITSSNGVVDSTDIHQYYIMKFSSSGLYKWTVGIKKSNSGEGSSIYLKGADLYSLSYVYGDQDSSIYQLTSTDGSAISNSFYADDFFITNYDTSGILKRIVQSGFNYNKTYVQVLYPNNVVVDKNQNFIITGVTQAYGQPIYSIFNSPMPTNGIDGFFCKINSNYCSIAITPKSSAGPDATKCRGDTTVIGSSGESENYYCWTSKPEGFSSFLAQPFVAPLVTTKYFLSVTNSTGVIAKDSVTITVLQSSLAQAGADDSICKGSSVTIGLAPVVGNTYSWSSFPGGFISNVASPVISPTVNTQYYLSVSNGTCVGKDTVAITVQEVQMPGISISTSDTNICAGTSVTFTALPVNGGLQPSYQWNKNGINVGANSVTYSSNSLVNGDIITVSLTSNAACSSPSTVSSNSIMMGVNSVSPVINISGNTTVNQGTSTTITSAITGGGISPAYQWQDSTDNHLWLDINGAGGSTINYVPIATGGEIRCVLTSSEACVTGLAATSNVLIFTVTNPVQGNNNGMRYYPNPVHSILNIDSLNINDQWETISITGINGLQNIISQNVSGQTKITVRVIGLPSGMYIAILKRKQGRPVYLKFIKL